MLRALTVATLLLAGLLVDGCAQTSPFQPPPVDGSACPAAESRLRELGCRRPDGGPAWQTPKGLPFAEACARAARDGRGWRADCLATIRDCGGIEAAYAAPSGSACP